MPSRDQRPRKKKKPAIVASVIAGLLLLLAMLFRGCLGLGTGSGERRSAPDTRTATPPGGDAQAAQRTDARARAKVCVVKVDSRGIWVDGESADVSTAVRVCRAAGRVSLKATGGARTGTYEQLVRALAEAGVEGVPEIP